MPLAQIKTYAAPNASKPALPDSRAKRVMDVGLIFLFSPIIISVLALIASVLWLRRGRVLYSQFRVGKDGQLFRLWKFQTMVPNADLLLVGYLSRNPDAAREWEVHRKLQNDPRVTRFGRFLRKTSLDELPQLWNILHGEMSLVGPRPVPLHELQAKYRHYSRAYMKCRPGLTGLWQISGRRRADYEQRVRLDVVYATRHNLKLDLYILWRTIPVVLRGDGC